MKNIAEIELIYLEEIIPKILLNKFSQNNLFTIEDVLNISVEDFKSKPSIGITVVNYFIQFKDIINTEPERIVSIYRQNAPKSIPFDYSEYTNLLDLFENITEYFLTIIQSYNYKNDDSRTKNIRNIDIVRKNFGLKSIKYDKDKIARRHRVNRERIRQISNTFLSEIRKLINGNYIEEWKCEVKPEAIETIQSFKKDLAGFSILSEHLILLWLKDYGMTINNQVTKNFLYLLLNAWGYEQLTSSRHYHLLNHIFFVDESIDKELFLNISNQIVIFLEKRVIPVSFDDIVIEILDEFTAEDDLIKLACNSIYEIEKTENDYYQIRFENLSSINDYVFRLLYEKQKSLSYNELLHLINKRLVIVNKSITIESLKNTLRKDDKVLPIGRTGIWSLRDLNPNVESQIDLILKTFRTLDKPLTVLEITKFINENYLRIDVSARSVSSNLRNYKKHFITLKNKHFALFETTSMYKDDIVKTRTPSKKSGLLLTDDIRNQSIRILETAPNNQMYLKELVGLLIQSNSSFYPMLIYKAISMFPLLFKKENTSSKKKIIKLVNGTNQNQNNLSVKYNWYELKRILERELTPIFSSSIQPSYPLTISDSLDAFFKLVTMDVTNKCPEQIDLAERLLPTLYKFYVGATDRNDKLNFLKQIVTCQESFFKKLVYLINKPDYLFIINRNKGFGFVLEKLDRIDINKNRYQEIKAASTNYFGKHCSRAYNNRNIDTHNAQSWTETEIIDTKTSCLVFMVYACFEYFNEIKRA